jgi:PIN domain nuclease of toxin-antitoxin system
VRVLLDTQTWLWMLAAPERLAPATRKLLTKSANELLLSAASAWEIAIMHGLRHALRAATLPPKHRDPFDRMLVAQAQIEDLSILTADRRFRVYEVRVIKA